MGFVGMMMMIDNDDDDDDCFYIALFSALEQTHSKPILYLSQYARHSRILYKGIFWWHYDIYAHLSVVSKYIKWYHERKWLQKSIDQLVPMDKGLADQFQ